MTRILKRKLEDLLVAHNLVTKEDLEKALETQKSKGGQLSRILIEQNFITEEQLMLFMGQELRIPPINLSRYRIDPSVIKIVPEQTARHYQLIPISEIGGMLTIAVADPLNVLAIDDVKLLTRENVELVVSTPSEIEKAINHYYRGADLEISEIVKELGDVELIRDMEEGIDLSEITRISEEAPVVKMINLILLEGIKRRASDVHLEPYEDKLRLRYRVDGNLVEFFSPPKKLQQVLIARLKIMSKLDITQRRMPQDGRFKIKLEDREIDYRVSILPVNFGEKIVLRALDKSNLRVGLEQLGFLEDTLAAFQEAVKKPYGMILVTGPTGSGKSTTLYSVLNKMNSPEKNIVTIEDPVEYQLEGISQLQVYPEIGLTFASGLRGLLRQSPDVIMVGEIRDSETADIAIKAALTGQLVLSTLHTNDAAGAITRLIDMGVEPFLIASSVVLVGAQRLCRRVCPNCREKYEIPRSVVERIGIKVPAGSGGIAAYRGKGCVRCNQKGYYGRVAILEVLVPDEKIKDMIIARSNSNEIKAYSCSQGFRTLRDAAWENVLRGVTSLEELLRVTSDE